MGQLVLPDLVEASADRRIKSGILEIGVVEQLETLTVEGCLDELQIQGELQSSGI